MIFARAGGGTGRMPSRRFPCFDRLVTQRAMRRFAPANVEQLLKEHGVVLGRAQQPLAVARMYGRLLAREKSGADPCARGAECEHRGEPATVSNAAGRNHGSRADRIDHRGNKRGKVATVPRTCPPASQPCTTSTSTPLSTARRAMLAEATV